MLLLISTALAGPWVHPESEGYLRLGAQHFGAADSVVEGQSSGLAYASNSVVAYGEWGLGEQFQVVASLPFISASHTTDTGIVFRHRWTGDLRVEVDRSLGPRALAIGVEARFPTYKEPVEYASAAGIEDELVGAFATSFPPLGDKNTDLTLKLMAGVGNDRGWLSGEVGPTLRFGGFGHSAWASANAGIWAVEERLAVGLYGNLVVRAPWIEPDRPTRQGATVLGQVMWTGFEAAPGLGLELNGGGMVWADAATRGWSAGAGVSYRRTR
ncbi:MAG: hypothetical protein GY913_29595 [Proteobacteria bacterium]|nr:hypothetical protein [Pseudomonadota bacterium]MCP4921070.1 hypothetical protein [Pseudomonadota bacterium]